MPETDRPTSIIEADTYDSKIIAEFQYLKNKSEQSFEKKVAYNAQLFEDFYLGDQWNMQKDGSSKTPKVYNGAGEEVWWFAPPPLPDDVQKRTINKIFPKIETQTAIFMELEPTVHVRTRSLNQKYQEKAHKLNLLLDYIFLQSRAEHMRMLKSVQIYGHCPIVITQCKKDNQNPNFKFKVDPFRNVIGDMEADNWDDVQWVIRSITKYRYELVKLYDISAVDPDIETDAKKQIERDYQLITLYEYWRKNENDESWDKFIIYKDKIVKRAVKSQESDNSPVLPIEVFRLYSPPKGWWGISEVQNMWEQQKTINKRASAQQHHLDMKVFPAMAFESDASNPNDIRDPNRFIRPDARLPMSNGMMPVVPIESGPLISMTEFQVSMDASESDMENISGVQKGIQGTRDKGVYSGALYQQIRESNLERIKGKEAMLRLSYEALAKKLLIMMEAYLGGSGEYIVYDPINDKDVKITGKDFKDIDKFDFMFETVDANLMSPSERLQQLINLKQYAPEMDGREIIRASTSFLSGLFPNVDYIKYIEEEQDLERKVKEATLKQQLKELTSTPQSPKAPVTSGGGNGRIQAPTQPAEQQQAVQIPPEFNDYIFMMKDEFVNSGMDEQQAIELVSQAAGKAMEENPNADVNSLIQRTGEILSLGGQNA